MRRSSRLCELAKHRMLVLELPRDERATRREEVEDLLVGGPIEDARPLAPRFDEPDTPQRRQVLRGRPGLEPELGLERPHRALAVAEQLDDPHPGRMPQHPEETGLHLVDGTHVVRHARIIHMSQKIMRYVVMGFLTSFRLPP